MSFRGREVAPWAWASGHKLAESSIEPMSTRHGRRPMGGQDLTTVPIDFDVTKIMPLPWVCPKCGNAHLMYVMKCNRCGKPTPLGEENWRK